MDTKTDFRMDLVETAPCCADLTATLTGEATKEIYRKVRAEFVKDAKLPGFRPGKIPQNLFDKQFGASIRKAAEDEVRSTLARRAMSECKRNICGYPTLDESVVSTFKSGEDYTMKFNIEYYAEITLTDYKTFSADTKPVVVKDEDVDMQLNMWREQQGKMEKADRPAQDGDMLKVSYTSDATADAVGSDKYAGHLLNAENTWLILRAPEMLPGATAALKGASAGETREFAVTFPEDHYAEPLRGKTFNYSCTLLEVQSTVMPDLDDEFAKKAGFASLEELRKRVRENMEAQKKEAEKAATTAKILDQMVETIEFAVPPTMLKNAQADAEKTLKDKKKDATEDDVKAESAATEKKIRIALLLQAIAAKEKLQPKPEALNQALEYMAMREGITAETLLNRMRGTDRLEQIYANMSMNLAEQFLFEHADVKEVAAEA